MNFRVLETGFQWRFPHLLVGCYGKRTRLRTFSVFVTGENKNDQPGGSEGNEWIKTCENPHRSWHLDSTGTPSSDAGSLRMTRGGFGRHFLHGQP